MRNILNRLVSQELLTSISSSIDYPLVEPELVSMAVTSRCNSRCLYCEIWQSEPVNGPTLEEIKKLHASFMKLGAKVVVLSGGEPLLRKDLEDIISVFSKGMGVHVITNGVLLTKERAESLVKAGASLLVLSLDTLEGEVYEKLRGVPFKSIERALEALVYVKEKYPHLVITINSVISRYNMGHLEGLVREISEIGGGKINITFTSYQRRGDADEAGLIPPPEMHEALRSEMDRLTALKKEGFPITNTDSYLRALPDFLIYNRMNKGFSCKAGYTSVNIDQNLYLFPCYALPPIANLKEQTLEEVWFSGKMKQQRINMKKGRDRIRARLL